MNLFLRAKHWQLFLTMFGLPFLVEIVMMVIIFLNIRQNPDPTIILNYFRFFPLVAIIFIVPLFGWQWSIAVGLQPYLPQWVKMKITKFKVFLIIPIVYIVLILFAITFIFNTQFQSLDTVDLTAQMGAAFAIIFPIHIFSMFCLFYCIYFVAKTIKTVELQRSVSFNDFAGEFFLTWFFPIGIWILQPRINKIIENTGALNFGTEV